MSKQILFDSELRKQFKIGMDKVADPVRSTMGYAGRNVMISHNLMQAPETTKDGVKTARSISLKDPVENAAAWLTKLVAERTLELAGDSTTCATLLFQNIVTESFKNIEAGANSVEIKRGIEKAANIVIEALKNQSIPVGDSNEKIRQIATVSANNDEEIGGLIADAFKKIGNTGIILIEEGKSIETKIRIDDGYQFERGWSSPFWVTDKEKMVCELKSPLILFVDGNIEKWDSLRRILDGMVKSQKREILIIADNVTGQAFDTLLVNKIQNILNVAIINSPSFGEQRKQVMEDLAILTGGKLISDDFGIRLEDASFADCGSCEKVVITKDTTTIVNGDGQKEKIVSRSVQINALIEQSESDFEIEMFKQRVAKLNGGIAVFSVGGATEIEMKEKKDRVDDAIRATKCAIEEGIIPGGGTALIRCINSLDDIETNSPDEKTGVEIIKKSIEAPLRQIAQNAGKIGEVYVEKVKEQTGNFGYNVKTDKIEDLVQAGIIDATKVIRVALENAVSVANMVIISECLVVEVG